MRRVKVFAIISGAAVLWAAGAAAAAPPTPQYSSDDLVKTFAKPAAAAPPAAGTPTATGAPPAGECEKRGMVTGDDGVCEPVKNERGFSLPTRASMAGGASAGVSGAKPKSPATAPARLQQASISAPRTPLPAPHRDLLITFKNNSAELTEQAKANAKVFAEALSNPALASAHFEVSGYTNSKGASDKNMTLSQQRAEAVKAYLANRGVDASRIVAKGYGASEFAIPGDPAAAANRRVEARRID